MQKISIKDKDIPSSEEWRTESLKSLKDRCREIFPDPSLIERPERSWEHVEKRMNTEGHSLTDFHPWVRWYMPGSEPFSETFAAIVPAGEIFSEPLGQASDKTVTVSRNVYFKNGLVDEGFWFIGRNLPQPSAAELKAFQIKIEPIFSKALSHMMFEYIDRVTGPIFPLFRRPDLLPAYLLLGRKKAKE